MRCTDGKDHCLVGTNLFDITPTPIEELVPTTDFALRRPRSQAARASLVGPT